MREHALGEDRELHPSPGANTCFPASTLWEAGSNHFLRHEGSRSFLGQKSGTFRVADQESATGSSGEGFLIGLCECRALRGSFSSGPRLGWRVDYKSELAFSLSLSVFNGYSQERRLLNTEQNCPLAPSQVPWVTERLLLLGSAPDQGKYHPHLSIYIKHSNRLCVFTFRCNSHTAQMSVFHACEITQ